MKEWDVQKYCQILARDHYGKATKCMKCGLVAKHGIEWHHPDYSKPLEVIPLCKKCHGLAHRLGNNFECAIVKPRMKELSNYDND